VIEFVHPTGLDEPSVLTPTRQRESGSGVLDVRLRDQGHANGVGEAIPGRVDHALNSKNRDDLALPYFLEQSPLEGVHRAPAGGGPGGNSLVGRQASSGALLCPG